MTFLLNHISLDKNKSSLHSFNTKITGAKLHFYTISSSPFRSCSCWQRLAAPPAPPRRLPASLRLYSPRFALVTVAAPVLYLPAVAGVAVFGHYFGALRPPSTTQVSTHHQQLPGTTTGQGPLLCLQTTLNQARKWVKPSLDACNF